MSMNERTLHRVRALRITPWSMDVTSGGQAAQLHRSPGPTEPLRIDPCRLTSRRFGRPRTLSNLWAVPTRNSSRSRRGLSTAVVVLVVVLAVHLILTSNDSGNGSSGALQAAPEGGEAGARAAFLDAYRVFMHPRCMNCHPVGDAPLQGNQSRPHTQNVTRGPDGRGVSAAKCSNCHQLENLPGEAMPPGNPNWHMPPPAMPMVFEGMSPADLARQLKDPEENGGRTVDRILHHISEDSLVLWGWDPGEGRTKPPLTHTEFVAKMREWISAGAPIPE